MIDTKRLSQGPGNGWRQRLHAAKWFPHVPLFVATLLLGVLDLEPLLASFLAGRISVQALLSLSNTVFSDLVHGAPRVVAGVFLVIMSVGLLLRSRLAWVIVVAVLAVDLAVALLSRTPQPTVLVAGNLLLLVLLLATFGKFHRSSIAIASLFAMTSMLSLLAYAVVGTYMLGAQFSPPVNDFVTAFYFAIVSMSTVGYGDITPKTPEAHLFVVSIIVLGITVFATSLSTLIVPLISGRVHTLLRARGRFMRHSDHYVIVSRSALARNSYKELTKRGQKVVFILDTPPEQNDGDIDFIVGDASDLDVLRRANAEGAKAILALGDDDSANAFVVLAAKELAAPVKTVTVVNDGRNLARVKQVRPDLIISPAVLGGELLAMALNGESLEGDHLVDRLLQAGS